MASGLIVGESLFGVLFAGIVAALGSDAPGRRRRGLRAGRPVLGVVLFVALVLAWTGCPAARRTAGSRRLLRAFRMPDHHAGAVDGTRSRREEWCTVAVACSAASRADCSSASSSSTRPCSSSTSCSSR